MAAILRWMFVLSLLIVVAGGGAAYWFYTRSDEGLRQLVLEHLSTMAPTLKFDLSRVQFDTSGCEVSIYGLTAYLPDDDVGHPSLEVPKIVATLDSDPLTNFNQVSIQKLYIVKPKLHLIRDRNGRWDWLQTNFQPTEGLTPPGIEIDNGTIVARIELPHQTSRELTFEHFNVSARPADSKHLKIQIGTLMASSMPLISSRQLMLEVDAALDGSTWQCKTHNLWRVPFDRRLVHLFCDLSPEVVAAQVTELGRLFEKTRAMLNADRTAITKTTGADGSNLTANTTSVIPDFGARCEFDLNFRIQKVSPNQPLNFEADAAIVSGDVDNALLPFPLNQLEGRIHIDNQTINVKALKAANGETTIVFNGDVIRNKPISATVKVRGVELNGALKSRLPQGLRKVVQSLGLTGVCNADARITQNEGGWNYDVDMHLATGTVTHERFPLTIRDVSGDLNVKEGVLKRGATGAWINQGGTLTFQGTGQHSGQTLKVKGDFQNLGPEQDARIVITGENLPVDDQSLAACPVPVRKSIQAMNLKGRHDVLLRVNRRPGLDQKWVPELIDAVHDASMNFANFPYEIQDLRGIVIWNGDLVEFKKLSGVHHGATLSGEGFFRRVPGPGLLELKIDAKNAAFDRSLENALPKTLQVIWNQFQPQGSFDTNTAITWIPGTPCIVKLPEVTVRDGRITLRCFPWSLHNLSGRFAYNTDLDKPGKLEIADVRAQHESTLLSINRGVGWFSSWEPWKLDFAQLDVVNLKPDTAFRKALPDVLQRTFDFLQPTGVYSLQGPVSFYEIPGQNPSVGALWNLQTTLSKCSIRAGRRIDDIDGTVELVGEWDGVDATLKGDLNLDSLWLFRQPPSTRGYQFTNVRGPILYRNHTFIAGTEPLKLIPQLAGSPDPAKRISANFIKGTVYLDTDVDLSAEPNYRTFVELKGGKLQDYARQYLPQRSRLAGEMNGWMKLKGKGTDADQMVGDGKLVIAPAALYDSPLFAQMVQMGKLQSPDPALFERAELDFKIGSSRFDLNRIDLTGDTLSMRGRGSVRFDGGVQMDFGVYLRQLIPNPYRWSAIEVTGTVSDPKARSVTLPDLDGTLRQFFDGFDPKKIGTQSGFFPTLTGSKNDPSAN